MAVVLLVLILLVSAVQKLAEKKLDSGIRTSKRRAEKMKQGHVFLKKLPKQILQYAILLLGAFCALVPIVSCVTTAFKNDEEYRTTSVMTLPGKLAEL